MFLIVTSNKAPRCVLWSVSNFLLAITGKSILKRKYSYSFDCSFSNWQQKTDQTTTKLHNNFSSVGQFMGKTFYFFVNLSFFTHFTFLRRPVLGLLSPHHIILIASALDWTMSIVFCSYPPGSLKLQSALFSAPAPLSSASLPFQQQELHQLSLFQV